MTINANNNSKVAVGAAGKVYIGTSEAEAPADASTELGDGWQNFGYVSEDGITISEDSDSEDITVWGGETVRSKRTSYKETAAFTPVEVNETVLKGLYGDGNVTVTTDASSGLTKIVAKHSGADLPEVKIYIDTIHSDTVKGRYYAPKAQLVERGDLALEGTSATGREMSYQCNADAVGCTIYEYEDIKE